MTWDASSPRLALNAAGNVSGGTGEIAAFLTWLAVFIPSSSACRELSRRLGRRASDQRITIRSSLKAALRIDPPTARQSIEKWYAEQGMDWPDDGSPPPYTETIGVGTPLISDDADVSVIASHLSRFAIDLFARPDATIFPYSAYLIGLAERWIFTAPSTRVQSISARVTGGAMSRSRGMPTRSSNFSLT